MAAQIPAPGEANLMALFSTLKTALSPETFVFATLSASQPLPPGLDIQMMFRESEGITIITTQTAAISHGLEYIFPCRMITLDVHSSLEAVGFIAAVSTKFTERGIGVNPVSGFFHDHCFVPLGKEGEALEVLETMVAEAKSKN